MPVDFISRLMEWLIKNVLRVNTVGYEKTLELCLKGHIEDVDGLKFDGASD